MCLSPGSHSSSSRQVPAASAIRLACVNTAPAAAAPAPAATRHDSFTQLCVLHSTVCYGLTGCWMQGQASVSASKKGGGCRQPAAANTTTQPQNSTLSEGGLLSAGLPCPSPPLLLTLWCASGATGVADCGNVAGAGWDVCAWVPAAQGLNLEVSQQDDESDDAITKEQQQQKQKQKAWRVA